MKQFLQAILLGVFSDAFKFGTEPVEVPAEVESLNFSLANTRFDLALALPVVLVNLSNYTGLIMHHNEAITSDASVSVAHRKHLRRVKFFEFSLRGIESLSHCACVSFHVSGGLLNLVMFVGYLCGACRFHWHMQLLSEHPVHKKCVIRDAPVRRQYTRVGWLLLNPVSSCCGAFRVKTSPNRNVWKDVARNMHVWLRKLSCTWMWLRISITVAVGPTMMGPSTLTSNNVIYQHFTLYRGSMVIYDVRKHGSWYTKARFEGYQYRLFISWQQ